MATGYHTKSELQKDKAALVGGFFMSGKRTEGCTMDDNSKELFLRLLRKEEARMERAWWHLSYSPEPLMKVRKQIADLGGYK